MGSSLIIGNKQAPYSLFLHLFVSKKIASELSLSAFIQLGNIGNNWREETIQSFRNLIELDVCHIGMTDATQLFNIMGPSKTLDTLLLNENQLSQIPNLSNVNTGNTSRTDSSDPLYSSVWFPNLVTLGLKHNSFNDWSFLSELIYLPKLNLLLISDCPVVEKSTL